MGHTTTDKPHPHPPPNQCPKNTHNKRRTTGPAPGIITPAAIYSFAAKQGQQRLARILAAPHRCLPVRPAPLKKNCCAQGACGAESRSKARNSGNVSAQRRKTGPCAKTGKEGLRRSWPRPKGRSPAPTAGRAHTGRVRNSPKPRDHAPTIRDYI